jgi:hypothetical protein
MGENQCQGLTGDTHQLAAEAEPPAREARGAEKVPERVEEQRVEERLRQLDVAEMAWAVAGGLRAGLAAARADEISELETECINDSPSSRR